MKLSAWMGGAVIGAALLAAAPADAFVVVMGNSLAHDCFLLAKARVNTEEGLATCDSALTDSALTRHDRAATFVNRGAIKQDRGYYESAMGDFEAGIALEPDLGDAYVDRGAALIRLQRYDDAIADINHGMQLGTSYPHIGYYDRAVAEELKGQYKEAYYDFKHVLELEPNFTMASDQLKNFVVTTVKTPAT